jgi:hypothetical protein
MRRPLIPLLVGAAALLPATSATSSATATFHRPIVRVGANKSTNWGGYNQGTLEQGGKQFHKISGTWRVPTATQHKAGQEEFSSTWIGIGGGCVDAGCTTGDNTLIQAGTEQDVAANGKASYSAWWELIPSPSTTISNFRVRPGDKMFVDISETVSGGNVWKITVKNVTTGQTFTTTTPYSSTHATAEWIEETPLLIGTGGAGLSALPNLTTVRFNGSTTNGARANLKPAERILLVDSNNHVLVTPSNPDPTKDGFNACAFKTTCAAPTTG